MARSALLAKQLAAEALLTEIDHLRKSATDESLLERAQRAEVDSGLLLEELQALIQAKSDVAQQRADLDRANAMLMAERDLLCEQLDVSPDNVNLCQAVQRVLAAARRARGLEAQLRLLARQQRDTLLQLEAAREAEARTVRHWQACEQVYLEALAAHGIASPQLPLAPTQHTSSNPSKAEQQHGSASSNNLGMSTHLLQRLGSGGGADAYVGSPGSQLLPPTPPASDLNASGGPLQHIRRSHSLDSGLNSLAGLLDQLALGQLGSEDCEDYDRDSESYMWVESLSDEGKGTSNGNAGAGSSQAASISSSAAAAAAALVLLGGGASTHTMQQQKGLGAFAQQQQLQPVLEGCEEAV